MKVCKIEGCGPARRLSRSMCDKHYMRWLRTGDANMVRPPGFPGRGNNKHPLYSTWSGMITRCYNPKQPHYARYGGRGIIVCEKWRRDFWAFVADMGERPPGMTLDRKNPDLGYGPHNCKWATDIEQRHNWSAEGRERQRQAMVRFRAGQLERQRSKPKGTQLSGAAEALELRLVRGKKT